MSFVVLSQEVEFESGKLIDVGFWLGLEGGCFLFFCFFGVIVLKAVCERGREGERERVCGQGCYIFHGYQIGVRALYPSPAASPPWPIATFSLLEAVARRHQRTCFVRASPGWPDGIRVGVVLRLALSMPRLMVDTVQRMQGDPTC